MLGINVCKCRGLLCIIFKLWGFVHLSALYSLNCRLYLVVSIIYMLFIVDSLCCVCSDLKGNGLSGQIPDEIGDCSALKILWVILPNLARIGWLRQAISIQNGRWKTHINPIKEMFIIHLGKFLFILSNQNSYWTASWLKRKSLFNLSKGYYLTASLF